jgi:hypothetical protein
MPSGPDWTAGSDDRCYGFAPELIRMFLDLRGTVRTPRAVKSFPPHVRPRQRSTKPINASSSIICPTGLLTSIELARRLRPIRQIRRASSKSKHFLHRRLKYRLAGRIGLRWAIKSTTKRSVVGVSLADDGEVRFVDRSKPRHTWAPSPPRRRTSASESRCEPRRIRRSPRGAKNDNSMSLKNDNGG